METLEKLKGCSMGLYDSSSDDGASVFAYKVVDVTSLCPKSAQCIIKYGDVTRGRIAQINDWYEK